MFEALLYEFLAHMLWGALLASLASMSLLGPYYAAQVHRLRRGVSFP